MSYTKLKQSLSGKRLLLGVTASVAAYKAALLVRQLITEGAEVQVVMTAGAKAFITPLSLQALSGRPVRTALMDEAAEAGGMGHIELARWADYLLIAPASANFVARLATGLADDLLSALALATRSPIGLAPAMNTVMWESPATVRNVRTLRQDGVQIFQPETGEQACGETGEGRMMAPEAIVSGLKSHFSEEAGETSATTLAGRSVLITAGPTQEPIDPVRYISNRSSGKQGFALASACVQAGAKVTLIAGPVQLSTPDGVHRLDVCTAEQMYRAVMHHLTDTDIFIGTAAVADYKAKQARTEKMKKSETGADITLCLTENPDIIKAVARQSNRPYVVGFAAETRQIEAYAREKRVRKGLDMVIVNNVGRDDIGFQSDQNEVLIITEEAEVPLSKTDKRQLADQIVSQIASQLARN